MKITSIIIIILSMLGFVVSFMAYVKSLEIQAYTERTVGGFEEVGQYMDEARKKPSDEKKLRTALQTAVFMTKKASDAIQGIPSITKPQRNLLVIGLCNSLAVVGLCIFLVIQQKKLRRTTPPSSP